MLIYLFSFLLKFTLFAGLRKTHTIYPPPHEIFSSLNLLPLPQVKLIIVGQDPYHQPNQGHGIAFSVVKGVPIPPSLRNIYKELMSDDAVKEFTNMPYHGCLESWVKRGVLLLNSCLTVRRGDANSHSGRGWELFTDLILKIAMEYMENRNDGKGLVCLLWGKSASKKVESIICSRNKIKKCVLFCTSHPSPLGASKTNSPFLGSRCFGKANQALEDMGWEGIDWRVDDEKTTM